MMTQVNGGAIDRECNDISRRFNAIPYPAKELLMIDHALHYLLENGVQFSRSVPFYCRLTEEPGSDLMRCFVPRT